MSEQILHFIKKPSYRRVARDRVVRLKYAVFDADQGSIIEYRDDLYHLHGGYSDAFPKVEAALEGREVGDQVEVTLVPADGYGERLPALVITGPADQFPSDAHRVGAVLEGEAPDGHRVTFAVTRAQDGLITVDGNHPLAGRNLRFVFEILDVQPARPEELAAGRALAE